MLVSHRFGFIYTKTAKTGGTSVEAYFEPFCMRAGEWTPSHGRDEYVSESGIVGFRGDERPEGCRWWNHMPAARIREQVGEGLWASYIKFCVIRNPFEKAVSSFYFLTRKHRSIGSPDWARERTDFEAWLRSTGPPSDSDKYLIDGEFCLDDVVRYESLATDLERVCARLGTPWNPAALPRLKTGIRPRGAEVGTLYTEESRRLVGAACAHELERFGYCFPDGEAGGS